MKLKSHLIDHWKKVTKKLNMYIFTSPNFQLNLLSSSKSIAEIMCIYIYIYIIPAINFEELISF